MASCSRLNSSRWTWKAAEAAASDGGKALPLLKRSAPILIIELHHTFEAVRGRPSRESRLRGASRDAERALKFAVVWMGNSRFLLYPTSDRPEWTAGRQTI